MWHCASSRVRRRHYKIVFPSINFPRMTEDWNFPIDSIKAVGQANKQIQEYMNVILGIIVIIPNFPHLNSVSSVVDLILIKVDINCARWASKYFLKKVCSSQDVIPRDTFPRIYVPFFGNSTHFYVCNTFRHRESFPMLSLWSLLLKLKLNGFNGKFFYLHRKYWRIELKTFIWFIGLLFSYTNFLHLKISITFHI